MLKEGLNLTETLSAFVVNISDGDRSRAKGNQVQSQLEE